MTVRFDDAWQQAIHQATELTIGGPDLVLLRDVIGRISLIAKGQSRPPAFDLAEAGRRIAHATGRFVAAVPAVTLDDTGLPAEYFDPPRTVIVRESSPTHGQLAVMEQGVVGAEWLTIAQTPSMRRVTLYSYKGGVGRSTATFMLARALAAKGCCVLVVDLDLESPGIGDLLLTSDTYPQYGLVDFLVESMVNNEVGLDLVAHSSHITSPNNGEVWVAPATGQPRPGYHYLPKLNRSYIDTADSSFAERLETVVTACEQQVMELSRSPDYVLLDSRAGIHDVAAVAITSLSDLSLLFATDSSQTWDGYAHLFAHWAQSPAAARTIRERLRIVAAMVPSARKDAYLANFRDHAQACFARTLYDEATDEDPTLFNPSMDDLSAPHSPLPILFNSDLLGLDVAANPEWHRSELVQAAFSEFVNLTIDLLPGDAT